MNQAHNLSLQNINLPKSKEYSSGTEREPIEFYFDGLVNSNQFDLLLGYFSSSAINVLAIGFTKFLMNRGRMRLAINHFLKKADKDAITKGMVEEPEAIYGQELNFFDIKKHLNQEGEHFFNCIAWLIAKGRIDIKVIKPKNKSGIAHYKSGCFYDSQNCIKFKGSCNFTANALVENLEELEVKCSWDKGNEPAIDQYQKVFNDIFDETANYIEYLNIDSVKEVIVDNFGNKNLSELIEDEKTIVQNKLKLQQSRKVKHILIEIERQIKEIISRPKFPYDSGPRDYQIQAFNNWKKNNYQGVFAMATGTGKTITSLNCLLELYRQSNLYQAIILVPTNDCRSSA